MASQPEPKNIDSLLLYRNALASLSPPQPPSPTLSSHPPSSSSKLIPDTRFLVDSFRSPSPSSSVTYFLSHFHSDHYSGLSHSWSHGLIFCSPTTSLLLSNILGVPSHFVVALPLREVVVIDGSRVILVDANHCPGAVQFLFMIPGKAPSSFHFYVHTGDFRYSSSMMEDEILRRFVGCDAVFLDTTYCNPKFLFPSQEESVDYIVSVIERVGGKGFMGLTKTVLFLIATYVVGKEKILLEVARRCDRKVYVDGRKMRVLQVLGYGESGLFTENESESNVHVVGWNVLGETWPYFRPNFIKMNEIMMEKGYSRIVGFVPTGWTYEVKRNKFAVRSKDSLEIHLVPYSEHSNYAELREYVKFLRPKRVIPTVGVDVENLDSKHSYKMQKHFAGLVDEMANKKEFLKNFHVGSFANDNKVVTSSSDFGQQDEEINSSEMNDQSAFTLYADIINNSTVLSDGSREKLLQELSDSLPTWVTQEQKLHLISVSEDNIVEAVSYFYECETEFHEQALGCKTPVLASQSGTHVVIEKLSKLESDENSPGCLVPLRQRNKSPILMKPSIKRDTSPGKRKRTVDNKPSKKTKPNAKVESCGPKQATITKFFNKILPNVPQTGLKECLVDEKLLPPEATNSYGEEIDQFIQVIDGNESSRSYAAAILERAKGDISKALDMHYGNSGGDLDESSESVLVSGNLIQPQCHTTECFSGQEKNISKEAGPVVDLLVHPLSIAHADKSLVSLPVEEYNPIKHACWSVGQPAPYVHLARTFDLVEGEKGRIKATSMLCNMFRSLLALSPEDVMPAVYLCTNKIAADHKNVELEIALVMQEINIALVMQELNIGGGLVTSALEDACGTNRSKLKEMYNNLGDLGDVAQMCRQTQTLLAPPSPLLIRNVFSVLQKISQQTGSGSSARKKNLIVNLMRTCREKEVKYVVRTLVRNLRIGAMMRTILPALAQAVAMNSLVGTSNECKAENLKEKLQCLSTAVVEAYNVLPSLDLLVPSLISEGIGFSSSAISMVPGIPIKPMLAKITNGVSQALKLFEKKAFTCEYKYDGQRAQIHKLQNGSINVFSRNGEDATARFPDLINIILERCKPAAVTFILDAEVVAVDRKNSCKMMSFQELSSRERGRKDSSITVDNIKVEICVFVFDIMFANGKGLLEIPLRQRRNYLRDLFSDEKLGYFEYAKEIMVEAEDACLKNEVTIAKISSFLEDAFRSSCEGIMVKLLDVDAGYFPDKRAESWLKVKRDYVEGLSDSLDLVPIGAWHGNGRKAGWYSPFLMACYDPEMQEFQSVCRVMSGFSDAFYIEMKEFFSGDKILPKRPLYYQTAEMPDMWFSPELVWEVKGADLTISPVHQAAVRLVHPSRGISIRFPRFIRPVPDRNPEECSTAADIAEMFSSQTRKMDVTA
ncbi:hypothetical protein K2173_001264 [Erythroxylum novogranatense]|uniref:DNA ligase n=1 Tax=Erythroxylum novogranatense TaxID=1862640 RepID=A0AAV8T4N3_9ROSI|nr:hypothetical protein K2173_001264 [Erythroxylum novogranatense]